MKSNKKNSSVISIKKTPKRRNIGVTLFSIILIYIIFVILKDTIKKDIDFCEVQSARFAYSQKVTGMILRNEEVISTDKKGYVIPVVSDGSCVSKGQPVFKIQDSPKSNYKSASLKKQKIFSEKELEMVLENVKSFGRSYDKEDFDKVYLLMREVKKLEDSENKVETYFTPDDNLIKAPCDGIFVAETDGYEEKRPQDISYKKLINNIGQLNDPKKTNSERIGKIQKNIDSKIIVPLNNKLLNILTSIEDKRLLIRFLDDGSEEWVEYDILEDKKRAVFYFSNPLVKLASKRFVEVELVFDNSDGLKVPKTSITKGNVYSVPSNDLEINNNGVFVILKNGEKCSVALLSNNGERHFIASTLFKDKLVSKTKENQKIKKVDGVYVINQGYARFVPVEILSNSGNEKIVNPILPNMLLNGDLIASDVSKIRENQIVVE